MLIPAKRPIQFNEIRNFSGQWQHYVWKTLTALGHEVTFDQGCDVRKSPEEIVHHFSVLCGKIKAMEKPPEHIIGMSRHFSRIPAECARMLRDVVSGSVTQIHDGPLADQPVDTTFSIRNDPNKFMRQCTYVGWAADPVVLFPMQDPKTLRVLIDHRLYRAGEDATDHVTQQAIDFKRSGKWRDHGYEDMIIRRFEDGGVVTIENDVASKPFTREHVPFIEIVDEYRKAHIFIVTHHESLGLSVLESAMCGALVLSPQSFITADRLATVRAIEISRAGDIWWGDVLDAIDVKASRLQAQENNWAAVVGRIVRYLEEFKK